MLIMPLIHIIFEEAVPKAHFPTYIIMHATQLPSSLLNNPDAFPVWYQVWELHSFDVLACLIE